MVLYKVTAFNSNSDYRDVTIAEGIFSTDGPFTASKASITPIHWCYPYSNSRHCRRTAVSSHGKAPLIEILAGLLVATLRNDTFVEHILEGAEVRPQVPSSVAP